MILLVLLLSVTLIVGLGWLGGMALILLYLAVGAFLISYDFLFSQTQADEAESRRLLADLQSAHTRLQEYAAQAEELASARERNRLARELHNSVSQAIFSITLTSQSARILLEREPARVPEQVDRLQEMTGQALVQLRSLIAQLRPPRINSNRVTWFRNNPRMQSFASALMSLLQWRAFYDPGWSLSIPSRTPDIRPDHEGKFSLAPDVLKRGNAYSVGVQTKRNFQ